MTDITKTGHCQDLGREKIQNTAHRHSSPEPTRIESHVGWNVLATCLAEPGRSRCEAPPVAQLLKKQGEHSARTALVKISQQDAVTVSLQLHRAEEVSCAILHADGGSLPSKWPVEVLWRNLQCLSS